MVDILPFHGRSGANTVVDDKSATLANIKNSLNSVIAVAIAGEPVGQYQIHLVRAQDTRMAELLSDYDCIGGGNLPVLVFLRNDDPSFEGPPEPVS